ncbi:MAG: hypothetical protein ACXWXT_10065 [Candidatus Binatia bacterium]
MKGSELSMYLRLDDFIMSLLAVQAPYEWGWRMHPMSGSGWAIGMMIMMALFWGAIIVALFSACDGSSAKAKSRRWTRR